MARFRAGGIMRLRLGILALVAVASVGVDAQWAQYTPATTPKTADGRPNLTAPVPRAANRKPDLTGVWQIEASPIPELIELLPGGENGLGEDVPNKHFVNIYADYGFGKEPLTPAAAAANMAILQRGQATSSNAPNIQCMPDGFPLVQTTPTPFKIVQTNDVTLVLAESSTTFRQVFTDGRPLPRDPQPSWMGSSVGRWEGETFVVETIGFNDRAPLDAMGHMHSTALKVTERYHRHDYGHMDIEITFDDPETFTKPLTIVLPARLRPETDLIEYFCAENERDRDHLPSQAASK
jgi:hypothetical protein